MVPTPVAELPSLKETGLLGPEAGKGMGWGGESQNKADFVQVENLCPRSGEIESEIQPHYFLLPTLIIRITRVPAEPPNPFQDTDTEVDGRTSSGSPTGTSLSADMTALLQKCKILVSLNKKKKSPFKGSTLAPRAQEFVFSLCIFLHASPTGHPSKIMTWLSIPYPATHTTLPWNAPSSFLHLGKSNPSFEGQLKPFHLLEALLTSKLS